MLVSMQNLFLAFVAFKGPNLQNCPSGLHPGAKSFPMVPLMYSSLAWAPDFIFTTAEFNRDAPLFQHHDFSWLNFAPVICDTVPIYIDEPITFTT